MYKLYKAVQYTMYSIIYKYTIAEYSSVMHKAVQYTMYRIIYRYTINYKICVSYVQSKLQCTVNRTPQLSPTFKRTLYKISKYMIHVKSHCKEVVQFEKRDSTSKEFSLSSEINGAVLLKHCYSKCWRLTL